MIPFRLGLSEPLFIIVFDVPSGTPPVSWCGLGRAFTELERDLAMHESSV